MPERRVVIVVLFVSTVLTMLGVGGVLHGFMALSPRTFVDDTKEQGEIPRDNVAAYELTLKLQETEAEHPWRRPFGAANVVTSSMVLMASFLLSWKRRTALWWITQAVIAKALWILGYTTSVVAHLYASREALAPAVHDFLATQLPETPGADDLPVMAIIVARPILLATVSLALHFAALWRATRPDVREFLETAQRS